MFKRTLACTVMLAVSAVSGVTAPASATPRTAGYVASSLDSASFNDGLLPDPSVDVQLEKPEVFVETAARMEQFVVESQFAVATIQIPANIEVVLVDSLRRAQVSERNLVSFDRKTYNSIISSLSELNYKFLTTDGTMEPGDGEEGSRRVPWSLAWKAVKTVWNAIVKIAKKSGKWAWYKATRCANGAASNLVKTYGNDAAGLAADLSSTSGRLTIAGIAGHGCVKAL